MFREGTKLPLRALEGLMRAMSLPPGNAHARVIVFKYYPYHYYYYYSYYSYYYHHYYYSYPLIPPTVGKYVRTYVGGACASARQVGLAFRQGGQAKRRGGEGFAEASRQGREDRHRRGRGVPQTGPVVGKQGRARHHVDAAAAEVGHLEELAGQSRVVSDLVQRTRELSHVDRARHIRDNDVR